MQVQLRPFGLNRSLARLHIAVTAHSLPYAIVDFLLFCGLLRESSHFLLFDEFALLSSKRLRIDDHLIAREVQHEQVVIVDYRLKNCNVCVLTH